MLLACAVALLPAAQPAGAQEQDAEPGPEPEAEAQAEEEEERDVEPNRADDVEGIELEPEELPGFWEGSTLVLMPRSYYLDRDHDTPPDSAAWALGGALEYRSGWWRRRVRVGATLFTSQRLYGPEDEDGTQLLEPGQKGFSVLGEGFVTLRLAWQQGFRIGRQSFTLPYLSREDSRMVPNTFEAAGFGNIAETGLAYIAAYVDAIKRKDDDEFIPLSVAAGAAGSDEGMGLLGARYVFADGSLIAVTDQLSFDVMNTFFVKAERSFGLGADVSLRGYLQYTDQRSVGDELIGEFDTHLFAAQAELFYPHWSFRLAASTAGNDRGIQSPYGGAANYLAVIVDTFDRAGEDAWMVGMSYDLSAIGVDGLSLFTNVVTGNTPDAGPNASPDETEYDLTVDYRFRTGLLDGFWLRVRGAYIDQDEAVGGNDVFDFRVILNYGLDLL